MSNNPTDIQVFTDDNIICTYSDTLPSGNSHKPPVYYTSCLKSNEMNSSHTPLSNVSSTKPSIPVPFIDLDDLQFVLYEQVASIQDPEFSQTLEELSVVSDENLVLSGGNGTGMW